MTEAASGKHFTTSWTLIIRAQGTGADARTALGDLVRRYQNFILWFIRRFGYPPDLTPEELLQEYFVGILQREDLSKLSAERGSFRGWLSASLRNFLRNQREAYRRRARVELGTFDAVSSQAPQDEACTAAFLAQVVTLALDHARAESRDKARFDRLIVFLPGPQCNPQARSTAMRELGLSSGALGKAISDHRRRFDRCLDRILQETLLFGPEDDELTLQRRIAQEKRELLECLEPSERRVLREYRAEED
jgi:RNA polymerase sigma factor (sigma-70 family)